MKTPTFSTSIRHLLIIIICALPNISINSQPEKWYDLGINDTLILRGYKDFAPFECVNSEGEAEGFDVELMKAVMEELGFKYRIELSDLRNSIEETKKSDANIILGISYSPERNTELSFGLPVFYITRVIISPKTRPVKNKEELKNKRIIVQTGGWTEKYVKENHITDKIVQTWELKDMLRLLKEGKGDVVIAGDQAAYYVIKQMGIEKEFHYATLNEKPQTFTYAVRRGNEELLFRLNEGVQLLKEKGVYDKIYDKWFGFYEKKDTKAIIYKMLIVFGILFILAFVIIFHLWRTSVKGRKRLKELNREMELALKAGDVSTFVINPKDSTIYPLSHSLQLSRPIKINEFLNMIDEADRNFLKKTSEQADKINGEVVTLRFKMNDVNKDFSGLSFETQILPIKEAKDKETYYIGTLKNITKDVEEQERLEKEREEAEKASKLKSAFLANMSHDIRSPLNGIVNFNEILNGNESIEVTPDMKKEMLGMIKMNVEVISTLINDVLDMAKFESGTYNVNLQDANVNMLCQAVIQSQSSKVHENVKLVYVPEDKDIILRTDFVRLQQVLSNFLSNACKYTDKGSIELRYSVLPEFIRFSVTDTGRGIKKEDAKVCFDRFKMLDNSVSGTGLGLHICKLIAEILKANIYVDTSYTQGARFVFDHPINIKES